MSDIWDLNLNDAIAGNEDISNEISAIVEVITKFEKSDRADRHLNPGALAVKTKGVSKLIQDLWHKFHLFPDYGDTFGNGEYSTLDFNNKEDGLIALRYVVGKIFKNTFTNPDADIYDFVSTYTGLPKDHEVVKNYGNEIRNNLNKVYEEGK